MEDTYNAQKYGKKEEAMMRKFQLQVEDAKTYFINCIKPQADRAYKLYMSDNSDRAREIKSWQCVSADTEILSCEGWKSIGELKKSSFCKKPESILCWFRFFIVKFL